MPKLGFEIGNEIFPKRRNFSRPFLNFLLSCFQQPDVDANSDIGNQGQPDAVAVPIGEGGGQFDAVAVVGPIGPELFGAAPFPGQRSFLILVSEKPNFNGTTQVTFTSEKIFVLKIS